MEIPKETASLPETCCIQEWATLRIATHEGRRVPLDGKQHCEIAAPPCVDKRA
jgi:hypothetical protein